MKLGLPASLVAAPPSPELAKAFAMAGQPEGAAGAFDAVFQLLGQEQDGDPQDAGRQGKDVENKSELPSAEAPSLTEVSNPDQAEPQVVPLPEPARFTPQELAEKPNARQQAAVQPTDAPIRQGAQNPERMTTMAEVNFARDPSAITAGPGRHGAANAPIVVAQVETTDARTRIAPSVDQSTQAHRGDVQQPPQKATEAATKALSPLQGTRVPSWFAAQMETENGAAPRISGFSGPIAAELAGQSLSVAPRARAKEMPSAPLAHVRDLPMPKPADHATMPGNEAAFDRALPTSPHPQISAATVDDVAPHAMANSPGTAATAPQQVGAVSFELTRSTGPVETPAAAPVVPNAHSGNRRGQIDQAAPLQGLASPPQQSHSSRPLAPRSTVDDTMAGRVLPQPSEQGILAPVQSASADKMAQSTAFNPADAEARPDRFAPEQDEMRPPARTAPQNDAGRAPELSALALDQTRVASPSQTPLAELGSLEAAETSPIASEVTTRPNAANPMAAPVLKTPLAQQVLPHLADLQTARADQVEITLSPDELGRVRLTATQTEQGVVLVVQAERPDTLELMRRNMPDLLQDLKDMGFGDINYSDHDGDGDQTAADHEEGALAELAIDPHLNPQLSTQTGLDLRL